MVFKKIKSFFKKGSVLDIQFDAIDAMHKFEAETGKHAVWHDTVTKGFYKWLKKNYEDDKVIKILLRMRERM